MSANLTVRAAQVYLTYLNLHPGTVDGLPGRFTFAALNEFQSQQRLPISNEIDAEIVARLKEKALAEP
jgi:hypothetical protein